MLKDPQPTSVSSTETLLAKMEDVETVDQLSANERDLLQRYEAEVQQGMDDVKNGFAKMTHAICQIREGKLYRETHHSFKEYARKRWGYERAHANRLADIGKMQAALEDQQSSGVSPKKLVKLSPDKVSPQGVILPELTTQAHFRPLLPLKDNEREKVFEIIDEWRKWENGEGKAKLVTSKFVEAATLFITPAKPPSGKKQKNKSQMAEVLNLLVEAREKLPADTTQEILQIFDGLEAKIRELGRSRSTDILWTDKTWNPLQGCSPASDGCKYCYAAKLVATRLRHKYPGLTKELNGGQARNKGHYVFNGKILLLPETLGEPLKDHTPKFYFVNSMSDLFHPKVPKKFIDAVFDIMEKATWHVFQVLTKRPERMAAYSQKRYKRKTPPENIWLGTSVEDEANFKKRIKHILKIKTAVRWLSCEPLLGPVNLDLKDLHWIVVGGESGSDRQMKKEWVTPMRDACLNANVPFLFKQWGAFGEDGTKKKRKMREEGEKKDEYETLDGKLHLNYPPEAEKVLNQMANPAKQELTSKAQSTKSKPKRAGNRKAKRSIAGKKSAKQSKT